MTDQTPSTDDVRDCYATGAPNPSPRLKQQSAHLYAEFDAWLATRDAARDREVAAKALREAATNGHRAFTDWVSRDSDRDYLRGLDAVLTCDLRAMADRIEKENN